MLACTLVVLACAFTLAFLTGCKYSDVLTQHIEDPDKGVLDENAEPIYKSNPKAPKRPDLIDVTPDEETEDENSQEAALPQYDPEGESDQETDQRSTTDDTPHDQNATEASEEEEEEPEEEDEPDLAGDEEDEESDQEEDEEEEDWEEPPPEEEPEGMGDDETSPEDNPESDNGDNEGDGEDLTSDEGEEPEESDDAGAGNDVVVVDDEEGTNEEVAKGTVAAVGEYATIAQMLGGAGALAAADEEWLAARASDGAFSGELDRVEAAFSGDGSGGCDVDALVNTIKPSVVLWDGVANMPALSDSDRSTLEQAGIRVQSVPHLGEQTTEDATVTSAVQEVAAVLQGASGITYDPADVLSQYLDFHNAVLTDCYNSNGGYSYKMTDSQFAYLYQETPLSGLSNPTTTRITTAYIDRIMQPSVSSAKVAQNATTVDGVIRLANDGQQLDVSDGVGLSATTNTSAYMLIDYYLQLAGVMNNAYDAARPESQGRPYIIMPGSTEAFGRSGKYASRSTASALFYNAGDGTVTSNWHVLGNEDFPAVLAGSADVANAILSSASKENGLYHMESPYEVIVVPSGMHGLWSEGHVDSFLLAPWAFRLRGADNLSAAEGIAQNFYSTFMRCDMGGAVSDWDNSATAQ